jgi:outer membrane protein assembly factor BamB
VVSVDVQTGTVGWTVAIRGGVDGDARYDEIRRQVYVGTDDGLLYALRPDTGAIRWSYRGKGPMDRGPAISAQGLFLTTAADRLIALDPETGVSRWQYERETPEGFTIHGFGSPHVAHDRVLAGFADGYLVALQAETGALIWARSLAAASEQHVDVDATPVVRGETVYAASFLGGIYALRMKDGEVLWRTAMEGTSGLTLGESRLYAAVPSSGLVALSLEGNLLWRQGLAASGDITPPVEIGPYLIWSTSRDGLFIVERATGKLLQTFDPGRGMCASPTVDVARRRIYILANNGTLYALSLAW